MEKPLRWRSCQSMPFWYSLSSQIPGSQIVNTFHWGMDISSRGGAHSAGTSMEHLSRRGAVCGLWPQRKQVRRESLPAWVTSRQNQDTVKLVVKELTEPRMRSQSPRCSAPPMPAAPSVCIIGVKSQGPCINAYHKSVAWTAWCQVLESGRDINPW